MKISSWNCRGAVNPPFVNYSKTLIRQHNVDAYCFLKTKLSENALPYIYGFMGPTWDTLMIPA